MASSRLKICLWVTYGTGKYMRHLPAHEMASALGPSRCSALPMFHAFTGCDSMSFFAGRGKKTAFDVWKSYDMVTEAFQSLSAIPMNIDDWMGHLERFVVLLYDRISGQDYVNQAWKEFFYSERKNNT